MNEVDWSVLEIEGVKQACERAAKAVVAHEHYRGYVEYEDLRHEAFLSVVTNPESVRQCTTPGTGVGLGGLKVRVQRDLMNIAATQVRRARKSQSYEARYVESGEEESLLPVPRFITHAGDTGSDYTIEQVEALLRPALDGASFGQVKAENAPDADMPRGSRVLSTGNGLAACVADVGRAWATPVAYGGLTRPAKRGLFLVHVLGETVEYAGRHEGVTHQAVSERCRRAVLRLCGVLNGTPLRPIRGEVEQCAA